MCLFRSGLGSSLLELLRLFGADKRGWVAAGGEATERRGCLRQKQWISPTTSQLSEVAGERMAIS